MRAGWYVYCGSAFGSGGLRARLGRHAASEKKLHWHVDYLLEVTELREMWVTKDAQRREHDWAALVSGSMQGGLVADGFGSSDCDCPSHLFYFTRRPSYERFAQIAAEMGPVERIRV